MDRVTWYQEAVKRHLGQDGERWIGHMRHLQPILRNLNIDSIIDFGCSSGYFLETLPYARKYGYDIDPVAVELGKGKGRNITSNWEDLPKVDCITVIDVIEHMKPDDLLVWIRKWCDKINPGGYLLIQTDNPYCLEAVMDSYNDWTEVRMYAEGTLRNLLELAGLKKIFSRQVHPVANIMMCRLYRLLRFPFRLNPYYKYWLLMAHPPNPDIEKIRSKFL